MWAFTCSIKLLPLEWHPQTYCFQRVSVLIRLCIYLQAVLASYLPLVQFFRSGWPQADQTVVLNNCARALPWWSEPFHLCHVIQALLDVAKVAGFGWGLFVWIRFSTIISLLILAGSPTEAALQAPTLLGQLHLTLINKHGDKKNWNEGGSARLWMTLPIHGLKVIIKPQLSFHIKYICFIGPDHKMRAVKQKTTHFQMTEPQIYSLLPRVTFWCCIWTRRCQHSMADDKWSTQRSLHLAVFKLVRTLNLTPSC